MAKISPFDAVHRQMGARFEEFDGWMLPADFGDVHAEAAAIKSHCAVVDLSSFGRLSIKGNPIAAFVGELLDGGKVHDGRWKWATLAADGMHLPCRIARLNGEAFIFTPPGTDQVAAAAIQTQADKHTGLTVANLTDKTAMLGLYGPSAVASVRDVLPFDISDFEDGDIRKMSFFMINFTLLRGSWVNRGDGLEIICPATAGPLAAGAIAKVRHKKNLTPAGMTSLQTAMTQA